MRELVFFRPMAYLDPGTGSFVIQLVLAGLLGFAVLIRVYWKKVVRLFKKDSGNDVLEELDDIDEYGDRSEERTEQPTLED